jgi:hypothetical protein
MPFDVVGSVMGDLDGDVDGYDVEGSMGAVLGRGGRHHHRHHRTMALPNKPDWRAGEMAPGVQARGEGLVALPMTPLQNNGLFTDLIPAITWQGQLQKPFRAERVLFNAARIGASATPARCLGQFFVGTDLQQAEIFGIDLELVGAPTAFGVRMTLLQAPPGVLVRVPITLSSGLTGTDTLFATMMFLGRVIH